MRPTYVLDTSAIIFCPTVFQEFPNSQIVIPVIVLTELDHLKKQSGETGKNARVAIRLLDDISNKGDISVGVTLDNDIILKIDTTYIDVSKAPYLGLGDPSYGDTQILACLLQTWEKHLEHQVCLVSNDINLRIKAKSRGISALAFEEKGKDVSEMYSGWQYLKDEKACEELQNKGYINPTKYGLELNPNECVVSLNDPTILGRKVSANKVKLIKPSFPWSVASRNIEQLMAIDLLMDKNIDLVTLVGKAGCGKSLVALACALELVLNKREYDKLIIYRPIVTCGNDLGYLPGSLSEKLEPWFQAIMDSLEFLFSNKPGSDWKRDLEMYQKKGRLEMSALTYIRGRSLPRSIILVDEMQNISKEDAKTILSRCGEGSRVLLCGDIEQIDIKDLDINNNALTYVVNKFKEQEIAGHMVFTHGERSRLATISSEIL
jgi:PhoH-like ATPase